jgi:hypothetical protein
VRICGVTAVLLWLAVLAVLAIGCGVPDEPGDAAEGGYAQDGAAHPFAVGQAPEGYRLAAAGKGTQVQEWGTEMGFDGAYTVVEVDDRPVVAGVVPWEPMESSLEGASFSGDLTPELFALDDGRPAAYGEGTDGQWDDLLIEVGPTEALSIGAERATRRELVGIAEHVVTDGDRAVAPVIDDPPSDWRVLGSVGVDTAIALRAQTYPSSNVVPGPVPGYGIGWVYTGVNTHEGPSASLSVVVLPGDDADLSALEVAPRRSWGEMPPLEEVDLNGRPGVLIGSAEQFGGELRSLVTNDASGALVVVTAYGPRMPADDELVTIAESVRPVDPAEWEQIQIAAFGGPELVPDAGESEIARGQADGVEWLLQTRT